MLIIMSPRATDENISDVIKRAEDKGFQVILNKGDSQSVIALIGDETSKLNSTDQFAAMECVRTVQRVKVPYTLASREAHPEDSIIKISNDVSIGGKNNELIVMSGPCSVESEEGIMQTARAVKKAGAKILRGGAFKPRTAPRTFEGLGKKGLELLQMAKDETGMPIVTEVMDVKKLDEVCEVTDIIQVGARNMQNFSLLDEVGRCQKPVLLKRGMCATIDEWLLAAERIIHNGNPNVIFCERGIRSFDSKHTRNVLDLCAIAVIKHQSHLPVISDPSHGTGKRSWVKPMALASLAAGADGLMIETHPDPANALSDGPQSLTFDQFEEMMGELKQMHSLSQELLATKVN